MLAAALTLQNTLNSVTLVSAERNSTVPSMATAISCPSGDALMTLHPAEELSDNTLATARDHGFVALLEGVTKVQQRRQQPDW